MEPLEQPRLTDTGFSVDEQEAPSTCTQSVGGRGEQRGLVRPADEARRLAPPSVRARAQQPPGLDGPLPSAHGDMSERGDEKASAEFSRSRPADHDRARLGGPLQTRGDVHRVAESDRMALSRTDHADRDLSAVDADPDVEIRQRPGLPHLVRVRVDRLHDSERRGCGPLCIVLGRGREAEERRNAVPHIRVDHTTELLDGTTHSIHTTADQGCVLLRVQPLRERRRADDVREQDADGPQLVLGFDGRRRRTRHRGKSAAAHREHLDPRRADLHDVSGRKDRGTADALAVHPRPVERPEIANLQSAIGGHEGGMSTRDLRIIQQQARVVVTPDGELPRNADTPPVLRAVQNREERRLLHHARILPMRWCQKRHQPYRPG